jgi:Putative adhesin
MKSGFTYFAVAALAASLSYGQMQDNRDKQMTCDNGYRGDRARNCLITEQSFAGTGRITVDGRENGGASVKGWLRNDILVRAKVESWADNAAEASNLTSQVHVATAGGQIVASGPAGINNTGWSVSYEIFVPQTTDLNLTTHNGGVSISDVRGRITFDAVNGGVHLRRIAGDVSGRTVNGGLTVELAGNTWEGRQLEARTDNGGVTISMPEHYSAHVETETVNGSIKSDFPVTIQGNINKNRLAFNVGSGGPLIHVTTTNGGVKLKRI